MKRLAEGVEWLSAEFSASRPEAQRALSDQVLQGLMAHGYAIHDKRSDRYAVSAAGRRMLAETQHG